MMSIRIIFGNLKLEFPILITTLITIKFNDYEVFNLIRKTYIFNLDFPSRPGRYKLEANAKRSDNGETTTSTRFFQINN